MITNEHIEQFIAQAHRVGDAGLTICSSGNILLYLKKKWLSVAFPQEKY